MGCKFDHVNFLIKVGNICQVNSLKGVSGK